MAATALTDRYAAKLHGVLSCCDRIIVTGTLAGACYAAGMTSFLFSRGSAPAGLTDVVMIDTREIRGVQHSTAIRAG
jgi:hypothetical protein